MITPLVDDDEDVTAGETSRRGEGNRGGWVRPIPIMGYMAPSDMAPCN